MNILTKTRQLSTYLHRFSSGLDDNHNMIFFFLPNSGTVDKAVVRRPSFFGKEVRRPSTDGLLVWGLNFNLAV